MTRSRRSFLRRAAIAAALRSAAAQTPNVPHHPSAAQPAQPLCDLSGLPRFVDPLLIPPRALPQSQPHHYRIPMRQFAAKVHRDLPPTLFWGYNGCCPGPTFDVRSGRAIQVEWVNHLPSRHLFPIDHTLHGAEADQPPVRTVVHLHGGRVPPESDGYPEHWIVPGQSALHLYLNQQESTALFYHDHAMGITRLNTVAGLVGLYLIRDDVEDSLRLPSGDHEIPLVLFDRSFHQDGRIFYPSSSNPAAPWVSEYYGSGILVNGKLWPYAAVEPTRYRLRLLNASNGSYYALAFSSGSEPVPFFQIGTDQGLLAAPVQLERLLIGPGERADLLLDFAPLAGRSLRLATSVTPILEFRVAARSFASELPQSPPPVSLRPLPRIPESASVLTRSLTLSDYQDRLGQSHSMLLNGTRWHMPVTETPTLDSTEIWSFINLTDDSHPIHLHLVRFQILDRRPYDLPTYQLTGKVVFTAPPGPLEPSELGWKDTVRVDPVTVTRIIVKFEGYTGRYVWHCHMLEHEDNEMMRPYQILPPAPA